MLINIKEVHFLGAQKGSCGHNLGDTEFVTSKSDPKSSNSVKNIGVRGFPNGIFDPWARWIRGLALARNSSGAAAAAVAVALQQY